MGDGKVQRIAVILNGDTETRHIKNVSFAAQFFKENGYDLYIASPNEPPTKAIRVVSPTKEGISSLISNLKNRVDDDDEIFIYTTGHGGDEKGGCLVLENECLPKNDPTFKRLFELPYGKRTVLMSQCYAGNWLRIFADSPRTLFISAGSEGERVCCQDFDPFFFKSNKDIPDKNGDGFISLKERYAYALSHHQSSLSLFLPSLDYKDTGISGNRQEKSHFETKIHNVKTIENYKKLLKTLMPGDVAVVLFSMPWCGACDLYKPTFERLAKDAGGKALFIYVTNADDDEWEKFKINSYPTVMLIDHQGRRVKVENRNEPLSERWQLSGVQWKDREYCLSQLKTNPEAMSYFDPDIKKDRNFVLQALKISGFALAMAGEDLTKDKRTVLAAVKGHGVALYYAHPDLKKDRDVVLNAVRQDGLALKFADPEFQQDCQIVLEAVEQNGAALQYAHPEFKKKCRVVLKAVKSNGAALEYADPIFRNNWKIVMAAVKNDGLMLKYASPSLQCERDIVKAAVKQNGLALKFASQDFKKDPDIVSWAIFRNGMALELADAELRNNKKMVSFAVNRDGHALKFASSELKKDRGILLDAVKRCGCAIMFADPIFRKDREVFLKVLSHKGTFFEMADSALKKDRCFVMKAVKQNCQVLEYVDPKFKKDQEIVLAAIKQCASTIRYADSELRDDKNFVLKAIKTNREAFEFVNSSLQSDPELRWEAKSAKWFWVNVLIFKQLFNRLTGRQSSKK